MDWVEKFVIAGLAALITVVITFYFRFTEVLPSGAVVAFYLEEGCPPGWRQFEGANGRTIIGVGEVPTPAMTERAFFEKGGLEKLWLSVDQLPPHTHAGNVSTGGPSLEHAQANERLPGESWTTETGITGGGKPIDIMPPFVALYYCIKD